MRRLIVPLLLLVALIAGGVSWAQQGDRTQAATGGLLNPGFEDGTLGGYPDSWTVTQPVPDVVKVVGSEGPAQFSTYASMGNVTVAPYKGNRMLRLGTPKQISENQTPGQNRVSQTFTSNETSFVFAFRTFSWDFRGNDSFGFNLTSNGSSVGKLDSPVVVTMPGGSKSTCRRLPCQFTISGGKKGDYLDTGWREVKFVNIPTGVPLELSYFAGGGNDAALGTWAYFDNVNLPPVAKFAFSPASPYEGTVIQFQDLSYDPNTEDKILSWSWDIAGDTFTQQHPFEILPDEGTYTATLTVTSSDGTSTTVAAGDVALDGAAVPSLTVLNAPPVLSVLNVETLAGETAPLLGRFADRGWLDTHTAHWSVGSSAPAASLQEDNLPILDVGRVDGEYTATSSTSGSLTVTDNDGGTSSASFGLNVVTDDPARFEPNDTIPQAPVLDAGGSYLSYIQSIGDVDVFEVKLPDGSSLPAGTEILASLTDLPADYDLVLLTSDPGGPPVARFAQSDFGSTAFDISRFAQSRFAQSRFAQSRFAQSRFAQSRFAQSRFAQSTFAFSFIPLSGVSYTSFDPETIGGTDITLEELGLSDVGGTNVRVAGFSANRGLDDEGALARIASSSTRVFVAVLGANEARSSRPFRLSLETSVPPDLSLALSDAVCSQSPLVGAAQATTSVQTLYDYPGAAKTLFVTQRERLRALYNLDDAAWNELLADLTAVAQQPQVAADIISLPSTIYDAWDVDPCDIGVVDQLTSTIRTEIQSRLGGIEQVTIIGDDDVVPFKRVPDETMIGNERDYAVDAFLKPGGALLASIILGYNKTDDYYVDAVPTAWQGRELYLPDAPISRVVETPAEIRGQAQAFVASLGTLDPQTGFVSGYDFFADGAQAMADALSDSVPTETLISDTWTADDLRCNFLGAPVPGLTGCSAPDIAAPNAHFTHYAALSSAGFNNGDFNDALLADEVADAGSGSALLGNIVFSMGCHAGLNVPDRASQPADAGIGINPSLDFAQALAQQRAVFIASLGFGLGETNGTAGTEQLMVLLSQNLADGGMSVAEALMLAKIEYIGALSDPTVYDEKSSIQTVLYGFGSYEVPAGAVSPLSVQVAGISAGNSTISLEDGGATTTVPAALEQVSTPDGDYLTADGETQITAGRPIEPKVVADLAASSAGPATGAVLTGGAYHDLANFDPVIALPTNEWVVDATEAQICLRAFWPADLATVNSLDVGGGLQQTLVVTPGQFRCTSGPNVDVRGVQRVYDSLSFRLLRCATADDAPIVNGVDLRMDGSDVVVTVDASDDTGLVEIVVLKLSGGAVIPYSLPVSGTSGRFSLRIPNVADTDDLAVQVHDGCQVTTFAGKGANLNPIGVDAGPDQLLNLTGANVFTTTISDFTSLTSPVSYIWDFGDGTFDGGVVSSDNATVDGDGNAKFVVQHTYANGIRTPLTAKLKITDAAGGIGVDEVVISGCDPAGETSDPNADLIGCGTSNDSRTMTVSMSVRGQIDGKVQYRVVLNAGGTDYDLRYANGSAKGLKSLRATVDGQWLRLTFDLREIRARKGDTVFWYVETQSGVPSEGSSGFPDRMLDSGSIPYTVK